MITLIGTSTTIIGFGLCGIERVIEVKRDASAEEIERHVDAADTPIVMLSERYASAIRTDKLVIPIPDRYADEPLDRISDLVAEVIGISDD